MTTMIAELRQALVLAGVPEKAAEAAAAAVADAATASAGDLATKADVRQIVEAAVAASEARLVRWVTALVLGVVLGANTALFAALRLTA